MSTNLGWPSEPDPEPEHRRLGWLARMLGVSRETSAETDSGSGANPGADATAAPAPTLPTEAPRKTEPESHGHVARSTQDTVPEGGDPAPGGPELVVEDPLVAQAPAPTSPTGSPNDTLVTEKQHQLDGGELGQTEGTSAHSPDQESLDTAVPADEESHRQPPPGDIGSASEDASAGFDGPSDGSVPDLSSEPIESVGTPGSAGLRGRNGAAEPAQAAERTAETVLGTPVDNAVDEPALMNGSEQENPHSGAGDNAVDESIETMRQLVGDADREALVAALPTPGSDTPLAKELAENARRRIQLTGRPFPKPVSPRVLTVANQKGGVGKTTTTVNVAAALAQAGLSVLVIDLDPQGNASTALGIDHHAEVPSIYDVLVDGTPMLEVVQPCSTVENLHCAPATIDLAGAEIELVSLVARESRLQKAIAAAGEQGHAYDYILIDCPPSLGLLTVNAMVAASEVFIPIQCEYYALEGLSQLLKNIDLVKRHLNPALHVSTILLTMYDGRTRLSAQVADEVREHFPEQVLRTTVPRSVRVSEAPSFGETVMTYDPASSGALAYLEAAGELADRGAEGRV
ncbi:MAG: AAA family ATPase [Terrabacter sp.]